MAPKQLVSKFFNNKQNKNFKMNHFRFLKKKNNNKKCLIFILFKLNINEFL